MQTEANQMNYIQVPVAEVKEAFMQPEHRVTPFYRKRMAKRLQEQGQLQPIVVWVNRFGQYVCVIGHTRLAGAQEAGWTLINAVLLPADTTEEKARDIFASEANTHQPVKGIHWAEIALKGVALRRLNTKQAENVRISRTVFGDDGLKALTEAGYSPCHGLLIKRFYGELVARLEESETPSLSSLGFWAVKHRAIDWMRSCLKKDGKIRAKAVARAVEKDQPLNFNVV